MFALKNATRKRLIQFWQKNAARNRQKTETVESEVDFFFAKDKK